MDHQPSTDSSQKPSTVNPESTPVFPPSRQRRSILPGFLKILVTAGFLLYAGLFLYHAYVLISYPYDVDNSEGFLIFGGHRLARGEGLYPAIDRLPYLVDNYPPLYPILLAIGDRLFGVGFVWGRALSTAATVGIAVLIFLWIQGLSGRRWPALISMICFLSFYHVYDWGALARVDMPAIFLAVLGLLLVEREKSTALSVGCFVLALCTRQTLVAAPLSAFLYLYYREERRKALLLLFSTGAITAILYVFFHFLSGGAFFRHVFLYNANEYRLLDVFIYFRHWWATYPVLGGIGLFLFLHRWRLKRRDLVVYYLFFSALLSLLCGKIGSAPNYLLEMVVATSLAVGIVLAETEVAEREDRSLLEILLPVLLLAQILATMHWPQSRLDFSYTPTRNDLYEAQNVERILGRSSGPILAERPGLPLRAGHEPVFQPFICTQLALQGLWDEAPLLKRIRDREFALLVLSWDAFKQPRDPERFTEDLVEAIRDSYEVSETFSRYVIYRPKR